MASDRFTQAVITRQRAFTPVSGSVVMATKPIQSFSLFWIASLRFPQ